MNPLDLEVRELFAGEEAALEALASAVGLSLSVARERARPEARLLVAVLDGCVVGFLLASSLPPEFEVLDVGVESSLRRRGVGRLLVEESLRRGAREGVESVFLEVRPSNVAALALYRRLGFEDFDVRRRYYADGEDAWVLRLDLRALALGSGGEPLPASKIRGFEDFDVRRPGKL